MIIFCIFIMPIIYLLGWTKGYNDVTHISNWGTGFNDGWDSGWNRGFDAGYMCGIEDKRKDRVKLKEKDEEGM